MAPTPSATAASGAASAGTSTKVKPPIVGDLEPLLDQARFIDADQLSRAGTQGKSSPEGIATRKATLGVKLEAARQAIKANVASLSEDEQKQFALKNGKGPVVKRLIEQQKLIEAAATKIGVRLKSEPGPHVAEPNVAKSSPQTWGQKLDALVDAHSREWTDNPRPAEPAKPPARSFWQFVQDRVDEHSNEWTPNRKKS